MGCESTYTEFLIHWPQTMPNQKKKNRYVVQINPIFLGLNRIKVLSRDFVSSQKIEKGNLAEQSKAPG